MADEKLSRNEMWVWLVEAETNERYFGVVTDICRLLDVIVKGILLIAATSSLAAVIADSKYETWLSLLSFGAAFIEVIVRPIVAWPKIHVQAEEWRKKWIDIREGFDSLWRANFVNTSIGEVDASKLIKRVISLEKESGYVPRWQWLVDKIASKVDERRRVMMW